MRLLFHLRFTNDIVQMNVPDTERTGLPDAVIADDRDRACHPSGRYDGGVWMFQSNFDSNDRRSDDLLNIERKGTT
jgi:hypothetical protein